MTLPDIDPAILEECRRRREAHGKVVVKIDPIRFHERSVFKLDEMKLSSILKTPKMRQLEVFKDAGGDCSLFLPFLRLRRLLKDCVVLKKLVIWADWRRVGESPPRLVLSWINNSGRPGHARLMGSNAYEYDINNSRTWTRARCKPEQVFRVSVSELAA